MQQALGRQDGVAKVTVSLLDGKVVITPKEDGRLDPARLLKATYDSGVTVVEVDLTARGRIEKDASGEFALRVAPNQTFSIVPSEASRALESLAGGPAEVTVRGKLYKKSSGKKKKEPEPALKLVILEVLKRE